ncbi:hypothetical protein L211DRAFT_867423 [Terfezia boudieri ATCC MYA-4762]|uniref:Uncharacterized protein n=1 Tax=Terfezia boudieri ATCC MYA-4762 TaxID=1051890 RepID=A0A3N4M3R6_9PEZI|nr:hypothetical protein L211DRAFT_867423 [Terfezia boudieri ATCC MYA-4762]
MPQLTFGFILLLLFTLSAVSAHPTPSPDAKNVVRENSLTQGAISKFASNGPENPAEDGEEDTDVQLKVEKDEHKEEQETEGEQVVNFGVDNDSNKESKDEVKVVVEINSEVDIENNNKEGQSKGSSEAKFEVGVKADNNCDEGDSDGEVEVIVEEAEEPCDEERDGKDVCSAPETEKSYQREPSYEYEQEEARYGFKFEPEFEEEEAIFFHHLPSESDRHPASVRFNRHESSCYQYFYAKHESYPRAQFPQPEDGLPKCLTRPTELLHQYSPQEEKPKSYRPGFRIVSVNVTQSQPQPAEAPLTHTLVHPSPLPQVEIHPIDATKAEQEQEQGKQEENPHACELQELEQPENQRLEQGEENIGAIVNSQSTENIFGKRSAEPKRLPAHHVMEKHLKLAEASPHLLGIEGVDQFKDIWENNLPYPIDGSPMRVGGPIRKRSAGRESRVVEQRQKENELRQAYGKPIKATAQRPEYKEKDIGLQEIKDEKNSLSELSKIGYKLDLGKTDEEIALEQEQELQQQITQQQHRESCNSDACLGNAERKREKEHMRHGDAGLLVQLFPSQRQN